MRIFKEFGTATQPPSPLHGHPHIITLAVLTAVKELYERHSDTYLDKLQWFLAIHHDIVISISALQENLNKAGLTRKMLHKIAHERDEERRAEFLHCIQNDFSSTGGEFVALMSLARMSMMSLADMDMHLLDGLLISLILSSMGNVTH
jgi:hypothetical protein